MKQLRVAAAVTASLIAVAGCGAKPSSPTVPRLANGSGAASSGPAGDDADHPNAVGGDGSAERRAKLHAAAECIRQHSAPNYQDPVLTADGFAYTDDVALRDLAERQLNAIDAACGELIRAARFAMRDQGPPPPKLIQAGVRSAQCLRANGLPDYKDPTAASPFVPGKGFGLDPGSMPAGGKTDPTVRRALTACRQILNQEAALSSLGNLGNA